MKNESRTPARRAEKHRSSWLITALIAVAVLAALALIVYVIAAAGRTDPALFTVEDGVLTAYSGENERTVTLPEGVVVVGERAFIDHTEIEKLVLPASLTTLRNGAFYGCTSLSEIKFADALNFIGDAAFGACTSLTEITLPASVQYIHSEAFYDDTALTAISVAEGNESYLSLDGVLYSADASVLIAYPAGRSGTGYALTEQTKTVAIGAFGGCTQLRGVDLGSVQEVGERAFRDCAALTSVNLPGTVDTVYEGAFQNCTALSSLTIGEGVRIFEDDAFSGCTALAQVELPDSMEEIGRSCFGYCTGLTYVRIPAEMVGIYETAFDGCENVTIYGYAGSPAETFAAAYDIPFEVLE